MQADQAFNRPNTQGETIMKKYLTIPAGLLASATLMMVASPAMAAHVDVGINIGIPGVFAAPVYVQPQPVYVQPQPVYIEQEHDWHEHRRHERHDREDRHDEHHGHDRGEHRGHDD